MKHLFLKISALVGICLLSAMPAGAEREAGIEAWERGDFETAFRELKEPAEQGDALSQYLLGQFYRFGDGVEEDPEQAYMWTLKSANEGYAAAQAHLAWMYRNGFGVERDDVQATNWYMLAAKQGNDIAQNNLGRAYELGWGIAQDVEQAEIRCQVTSSEISQNSAKTGRIAIRASDTWRACQETQIGAQPASEGRCRAAWYWQMDGRHVGERAR